MPEMDNRPGRIDPELDAELISALETFSEMIFVDDTSDSFFEEGFYLRIFHTLVNFLYSIYV
jgi:hypothetical protein